LLWYAGANALITPARDSSHRRPPAATVAPSRRGPTTSIGLARWTYGVHGASAGADGRAAAPPATDGDNADHQDREQSLTQR